MPFVIVSNIVAYAQMQVQIVYGMQYSSEEQLV